MAVLAPIARLKGRLLNRFLGARLRRVFDFIGRPGSLRAAHTSLRGIFSVREAAELTKHFDVEPDAVVLQEPEQPTQADNISALELTTYMRNQLLRDSDVTSMAWGLELRVPFVDRRLIDQISGIPANLRLRSGKKLLIQSVPEIPEWVINRPKQGFRFPFDEWFSDSWQDMSMPDALPSWLKLEPWYRRWSLLVLNDWIARYAK